MHKVAAAILIGVCFTTGLAASRFSRNEPAANESARRVPTGVPASVATGQSDGTARELKAIRALAGEVEPTLNGLLAAADRQPALLAEAVIIEALKPLGLEKWRELFEGVKRHRSDADRKKVEVVRRALLRLWAAESPADAMAALANRIPGDLIQSDEAAIVTGHLLAQGYENAVSVLQGLNGHAAFYAWSEVAAWCVEHAPDKISQALDARKATDIGPLHAPGSVLEKWAVVDVPAASRWADAQTPFAIRHSAMSSICEGLAKKDIAAARSWADSLPDESMRTHMKNSLARFAAYQGSPASAVTFLQDIDPAQPDSQNGALRSSLAERWALTDPAAALAWATAEQNPANRADALRAIAGTLAESATTWAEVEAVAASMPDEASRGEALTLGLANIPPAEVAAHLDDATGEGRQHALHQAITGVPPLPLDQVLALMPEYAQMEDADVAGVGAQVAARVLEARGPDAALAWAGSLPEEIRQETLRNVYAGWAETDPAAAAASAMQTEDAALSRRMLDSAIEIWTNEDPAAASEWLTSQPPGPLRDAAASRIVQTIMPSDPERALAWAATIEDDSVRRSTLSMVPSNRQDRPLPDYWRAAVEASPLSPEEKKGLLNPQ